MDDDFRTKCMNVQAKVILHRTRLYTQAINHWQDFIDDNREDVVWATTKNSNPVVSLKNGEEHHFVPDVIFDRWCRGRMYWYLGELHMGRYKVRGVRNEQST